VQEPPPEIGRSQVTLKTVFTVCFGLLAVLALVSAVRASLLALTLTGSALMLAVALEHGVALLTRRGLNRPTAISAVTVSLVGLLTGLGFTLIPPAIQQFKALVDQAPGFVRTARGTRLFLSLDERFALAYRIQQLEEQLPEMLEGAATPILAALGGVLTFLAAAITIFFLTVVMLIFGGRLIRAALNEARPERRQRYQHVLHKIYQSIGGYLGGLALICTINATLTIAFLAIARVPFFLPLGIVSGLSSTIPYAGPLVTGAFITLLALITMGVWPAVACGIYFIGIQEDRARQPPGGDPLHPLSRRDGRHRGRDRSRPGGGRPSDRPP
jgi:putative heme transporter